MSDLKSLFQSDPFSMAPTDINTRALEIWRSNPRFSAMEIKISSSNPNINLKLVYDRLSTSDFIYEGQTLQGRPFGIGRLIHTSSGNIFEGQLDGEMKNGYGRVIYGADVDSTYYQGVFLNDQRHGQGTMYYQDQDPKEGEWEHDEIQEFEEFDSDEEQR